MSLFRRAVIWLACWLIVRAFKAPWLVAQKLLEQDARLRSRGDA